LQEQPVDVGATGIPRVEGNELMLDVVTLGKPCEEFAPATAIEQIQRTSRK